MLKYLIKEETLTATAEAIRSKTGQEEEIKPIDFPQWISKLSSPKNIGWHVGSFLAESKSMTVEHGIEKVPDFLMININPQNFRNQTLKDYANASNTSLKYGIIYFAYGFSQALYSQFPESSVAGETRSLNNYISSIRVTKGMDNHEPQLGELGSVTDSTFTLGSDSVPLEVGQTYNWIAITGLS